MKHRLIRFLIALTPLVLVSSLANAHPHVFVEANIEVVRNQNGDFTEVRHVWRFDELFSATVIIDYDEDGDNVLGEEELKKVSAVVKESIAEYDFYTAVRYQGKELEIYEPEEIKAYYEDGRMIMFLSVELGAPVKAGSNALRVSASDTSYYVAFDFDTENVTVAGDAEGCAVKVVHPDFDALYAEDSPTLTESFFADPSNPAVLSDDFYSWANITCS